MRGRNAVLFLALAVAWGSAFTAIKAGLEYFPPVLFAAFRYDLAGLLMLGYAAYATERWRPRTRDEWLLAGVSGLLMIAAYHAFLFVGQGGTTSAAAAIVVSVSPILTTGFSRALLPDERLTSVGLVGLTLGLVGVIVLRNPRPGEVLNAETASLTMVFLAAAAFALGSVLTQTIDETLPIETMEAWAMLLGAAVMHGVSVGISESMAAVDLTVEALLALGYLVVVASAFGFLVYFELLERLGPIEINLVSYAAPLAAAATGFLVLGEQPTAATAGGFLCILVGFALIKRSAIRAEFRRAGLVDDG
jgi:drug/metabolite transporter (DMT)-like permease